MFIDIDGTRYELRRPTVDDMRIVAKHPDQMEQEIALVERCAQFSGSVGALPWDHFLAINDALGTQAAEIEPVDADQPVAPPRGWQSPDTFHLYARTNFKRAG